MDWDTDPLGRVRLAGLHDSLVEGFSHRDRTFEITLVSRENDGLVTELHLSDVRSLVMNDVWEATIVSDLYIWNAHDVPEDFRFDPNAGWRHLLDGRGNERGEIDRAIERALRDLPSGFLFSLTSSYGGSISVLCAGVSVEQRSSPQS